MPFFLDFLDLFAVLFTALHPLVGLQNFVNLVVIVSLHWLTSALQIHT